MRLARLEGDDDDREPGRVAHRAGGLRGRSGARPVLAVSAQEWRAASARPAVDEAGTEALVREHAVESAAATAVSSRGSTRSAAPREDLAERRALARDEGHAAGGGLEGGQAEALVLGEKDRRIGGGITIGEAVLVDEAGEADVAPRGPASGPAPRGRCAGGSGSLRRRRARAPGWRLDEEGDGAQQLRERSGVRRRFPP